MLAAAELAVEGFLRAHRLGIGGLGQASHSFLGSYVLDHGTDLNRPVSGVTIHGATDVYPEGAGLLIVWLQVRGDRPSPRSVAPF